MKRGLVTLSALFVGAVVLAGASLGSVERGAAATTAKGTEIHAVSGKLLAVIQAGSYGASGECWIRRWPHLIYAGITHTTAGGAVSDGRNRWRVWIGNRRAGSVVRHGANRWDLYRLAKRNRWGVEYTATGRVGYTVGPDAAAVGVAFILLGICQ